MEDRIYEFSAVIKKVEDMDGAYIEIPCKDEDAMSYYRNQKGYSS